MFERKTNKILPEEPSDPILPCTVEKIETDDGQVFILDNAKIVHAIEGKLIKGFVVDPSNGQTTNEMMFVSMNRVVKHIAMGWRNSDCSLHELISVTPWSLSS